MPWKLSKPYPFWASDNPLWEIIEVNKLVTNLHSRVVPPMQILHRQFAHNNNKQVKGSTASQVVRLIGLLLVFASQKIVHNV